MELAALAIVELWLQWLWPIILIVLGLGLVIFVHELGHFLVAKGVGIKVEKFALGFGPKLFGFTRGETEYSVRALPLGGYVKMLGQEDIKAAAETPDPRAYNNKPVWARLAVVSAGVVMNVLFAAVLFIAVCLIGLDFPAPVIGSVNPEFPAASAPIQWPSPIPVKSGATTPSDATTTSQPATAAAPAGQGKVVIMANTTGLQPGDRVLEINGKPITRFTSIGLRAVLAGRDEVFDILIERTIDGQKYIGKARVGVKESESPNGDGKLLQFGFSPASKPVFARIQGMIGQSQLQDNDKVIAINGRAVEYSWDIEAIEKEIGLNEALVTVERGSQHVKFNVQPQFFNKDTKEDLLSVLGMIPRLQIAAVMTGSAAAAAGLKPGDVIADYAGLGRAPTIKEILDLNKQNAGKATTITVIRDGQLLPAIEVTPRTQGDTAVIGTSNAPDYGSAVVAMVRQGSVAGRAGVVAGDQVVSINGKPAANWFDVYRALEGAPAAGELKIAVLRNRVEQILTVPAGDWSFSPNAYRTSITQPLAGGVMAAEPLMTTVRIANPAKALAWGLRETWDLTLATYSSLRALFGQTVSVQQVRGPLGIGSLAIQAGRQSIMHFAYFLAIISISLAVINFLPIPIVDGGHAVFLLVEKIRGKPVPPRVMEIAQYVGLILLLGIFVLAMWNDIGRLLKGRW